MSREAEGPRSQRRLRVGLVCEAIEYARAGCVPGTEMSAC